MESMASEFRFEQTAPPDASGLLFTATHPVPGGSASARVFAEGVGVCVLVRIGRHACVYRVLDTLGQRVLGASEGQIKAAAQGAAVHMADELERRW